MKYEQNALTNEDILKAKENGFILVGKTGTGKTTLLNLLYGMDIGKVGYSSKSETSKSAAYYIKESEKFYYCIIDTPGLYDTYGLKFDEKHLDATKELISKEDIKIKGILFLSNFQNERFDFSEMNSLIQYNALFPLKNFWRYIILIFTHYYGDPYGDNEDEMKKSLFANLSESFKIIMNKVKKVSDSVKFEDINKLFINIYSKKKNEFQKKSNESFKKIVVNEIENYIKYKPMYNKLNIIHFKKFKLEEKDQFLYDCDYYIYLNSNNKMINHQVMLRKQYKDNYENNYEKNYNEIELTILNCEKDEDGNIYNNNIKKVGLTEILKENIYCISGASLTVVSIICFLFLSNIFCLGVIPGAVLFYGDYKKSKNRKDEEEKEKAN